MIVLWLAAAALVVQLKWIPGDLQGPLLALGLVVIFMENAFTPPRPNVTGRRVRVDQRTRAV